MTDMVFNTGFSVDVHVSVPFKKKVNKKLFDTKKSSTKTQSFVII